MQDINSVISTLTEAGIYVFLVEGKLKTKSAKGALNPTLIALIKQHKDQLIEHLKTEASLDKSAEIARPPISQVNHVNAQAVTSFAQQRLWFIDQVEAGSAHYNMPFVMNLKGDFKVDVAEAAFTEIINRHAILRSVFIDEGRGQGLKQLIHDQFEFNINCMDLTELSDDDQLIKVNEAIKSDATESFNLSNDLMIRVRYFTKNHNESVMLLNIHHIVSDGWSIHILIDEFNQLYQAFLNGNNHSLEPLDVQYADYAHWQRQWITEEALHSQLNYWDKQLADLPQLHSIPIDHERPLFQTYNSGLHLFEIDRQHMRQLQALALDNHSTLFMVIHAAFSILLSRYSNNDDIVIATPVGNRQQQELESLIGLFVNTIILRADCSNNPSFKNFMVQIRQVNLDAQANQDVPLEHLVDRLKPNRSTSHNALFQIMLSMNNNEDYILDLPGVNATVEFNDQIKAKFDLSLYITEKENLECVFEYNADLFTAKTIQQLAVSLEHLLSSIVLSPDLPIAKLPLLKDQEIQRLLEEFNDTTADYPSQLCIHQLFEKQVELTPEHTAVVFKDKSLTYTELNQRANQLANHLITKGVRPDDIIGLCMERSIEMMVAILAVFKAGGAYLPLDPAYPPNRLEHMIADSGVFLVLTQSHLLGLCEGHQQLVLDAGLWVTELADCSLLNPQLEELNSRHLAYVIYTSGSTGLPKGVMVEHQALVNRIDWMQKEYVLTENDVILQKTPYSFDVSVWELTWFFTVGSKLVIAEPEGHKDPNYLAEVIQRHQVTTLHFVPSMFKSMLSSSNWQACTSLRQVFCSGESLPTDVPGLHYELNDAVLHNLYGPTEAAIDVSYWEVPNQNHFSQIPIGKPIQNIQLYILNDQFQVQPPGAPGELFIAGAGLARGYLNQDELTKDRFIFTQLAGENKRLYRTGDRVRFLEDGNIEFLGRIDHQVKLRGFRIELGEIESQLLLIPEINSAVAMVREDKPGHKQLVTYFTSHAENADSVLIDDIKESIKRHLPDYMMPSIFVRLKDIPLSANGKVDRKALPEPDVLGSQKTMWLQPMIPNKPWSKFGLIC